MNILLIEEDDGLATFLQRALEQQRHNVDVASDGQQGRALVDAFPYDLILLDWMLPGLDGISFCKQLRSGRQSTTHQFNQETPVLLMTAIDVVTQTIIGLDAGADGYLVKPLDLDELQAHIHALSRRGKSEGTTVLEWEGLRLWPNNGEVTYLDRPIALTAKEYQLLELLLRHPEQIFNQGRLIEHLLGQDEIPTENVVRSQIKGLRHKLKQVGATDIIETVYKLGYRLRKNSQGQCSNGLNVRASSPIRSYPVTPKCPSSVSASAEQLCQVWSKYRESYLARVSTIERVITALRQGQLNPDLKQQAAQEAHTLMGSLGSFGLEEASEVCRSIQRILKEKARLEESDTEQLEVLLPALRYAMGQRNSASKSFEAIQVKERLKSPSVVHSDSVTPPTLLIIDDDIALTDLLTTEAIPWGFQTATATNTVQARQQILQKLPSIVLLDLGLSESGESGLDFLAELHNEHPDLPVLVFTGSDRLNDRICAARLGCKGYFQKPIAPAQVLAMISQSLNQAQQKRSKLLIVDDDLHLQALLRQILEPSGYELTFLEHPQDFWDVLEQTAPDLMILDVALQNDTPCACPAMSDVNGFDLCQIVRNDPHWNHLPIIFLSASEDPATIQHGFEVGADDFLHKPISRVELLTRVRKRIEQGQIRRQSEIDELTGVGNRRKSVQDLTRLVRLAERQKQPFSLAVLDLDHFKQVNDQYGHEMGDRVLNYFGNLLKHSFREEDIVGRWGGEEFVVGLYGMSKRDGANRLTSVLQVLMRSPFTAGDGTVFHVSFSGGIAQLAHDGTNLQTLYSAADTALYRAKAQGRQQILVTTQGSMALK